MEEFAGTPFALYRSLGGLLSFRFSVLILCLFASVLRADPPLRDLFGPPSLYPVPNGHSVFPPPPLPTVSAEDARRAQVLLGLPDVEQLMKEMAVSTAQQFDARVRFIIKNYHRAGVERINQALERALEKNLSRIEMQVVLGLLEAATAEQMAEKIKEKSDKGPFAFFAQTIHSKLSERVGGTPEVKAVKILAKQVAQLSNLTDKEKIRFHENLGRFGAAFRALGDDKIDGKGMMLLLAASMHGAKNVLEGALRRVKDVLNPVNLETTLKAMGLLANTVLNPDPISKDILRNFLDEEIEKHRFVARRDGTVDWKRTAEGLAHSAPEDARNLVDVLVGVDVLKKKDVETALRGIEYAQRVQADMRRFRELYEKDPEGKFVLEMGPEYVQYQAKVMADNGMISREEAKNIFQFAGMVAVARDGKKFAEDLDKTLKTPPGWYPPPGGFGPAPNPDLVRLPPPDLERLPELPRSQAPALLNAAQPGGTRFR